MIKIELNGDSDSIKGDKYVIDKIITIFDNDTLKFGSYDFEDTFDKFWNVDSMIHSYQLMLLDSHYEFELKTYNKHKIKCTLVPDKLKIEVVDG
jgi:hypothetical protein